MYDSDINYSYLILNLRINAVLAAIFCGIGLSIAGLFLQTLFHNPLSSPFTLGISPISSLFTSIYIVFYSLIHQAFSMEISSYIFYFLQILFSFSGALFTLFIIQKFNKNFSNKSLLILVGILIGSLAGALQQIIEIFMSDSELKTNLYWNLGTFEIVDSFLVGILFFFTVIGSILLYRKSSDSNKYLLGEIYAQSLGLKVEKYQIHIILYSSIIISVLTAICGPIGFIGLISPHIAKIIIGTNKHQILSIYTISIGAFFSILCLIVSQIGIMGSILPINTVSSIIGVPITIYLLVKNFKL